MAKRKYQKSKRKQGVTTTPQKKIKKSKASKPTFYPTFGKSEWINSMVFIVLAFAIYAASISFGYILDDVIVINDNSFTTRGFAGLADIFSKESFAGYFGEQRNLVQGARYRPLSIATFAIEHQFFGQNPGISHFINILMYGLTGIALYFLFHVLYQKKSSHRFWNVAFIAALIYVAHPIHTEAVANIKGRDEIMAMGLALWGSIMTLKWEQFSKLKYAGYAFIIFLLGLLAKENTITFCAIVPAMVYVFRKSSITKSLKMALPVIAASIVYLIIRYAVVGYFLNSESEITDLMNNAFVEMSGSEKYATISFTLWKYLSLSIFPHPLAHDYYPYAIPILNWANLKAFLPALLYTGLGVTALVAVFRRSKNLFGLWFYLVTLSIVSNVVVNVGTLMNERFIFMASAGICLLMAVFLVRYLSNQKFKYSNILAYSLAALIVIGYSVKTIMRVPDWSDPLTLNKSAVKVNPGSARANSFMSTALYNKYKDAPLSDEKKQQMLLASFYAKQAIKVHPNYKNANLMRAGVAAELFKFDNDLNKLLEVFKEVISRRPDLSYVQQYMDYLNDNWPSGELTNFYYDVGYNMLFKEQRKLGPALLYLNKGYEHQASSSKIIQALAEAYEAVGNQAEANKYFQLLQDN
ncbi:MAG: hypothetical protein HKN68_04365 [Saprospiraceae bacterium]|nr:hypothetical protein [Saprospiraceae bacterium]